MNTSSNLAYAVDPADYAEPHGLSAVEVDNLLRLGSSERSTPRANAARGRRRVLVSFRDNHSAAFRPFRIY